MSHERSSGRDDTPEESETPHLLDRRSYLSLSAAAVSAAVGASGSAAASGLTDGSTTDDTQTATGETSGETHHDITFSNVLHAVDDLGMDPTGSESISPKMPVSDDTLVEFPAGTYLVGSKVYPDNVTNWGIRGTTGDKSDVRFTVPDGEAMDCFTPVGDNVLMEDVTFDQGPENHTSIGVQIVVGDGLQVHNVEFAGFNPNQITGARTSLAVRVDDPDGVGVIENFVHKGPTDFADDALDNVQTIWTGGGAEGTLYIRDAHIENAGCHSIYGSKTEGPVIVEGGLFKNCQNTHMRLCGEGTVLRDATVVIDTDNDHPDNVGSYTGSNGIWWESGPYQQTGGLIENCDIVAKSSAANLGLIQIDETAGSITIRDTRIRNELEEVPSIVARRPGDSRFGWPAPERPWDVTIDNVSVTGPGGDGEIIEVVDRDGSTVRNCCLSGGNGDGIRLVDASDCTIADTNIDVPGQATVFDNSSASTSNISKQASCPLPDEEPTTVSDDGSGDSGYETSLDHVLEVQSVDDSVVSYEVQTDGQFEAIDLNSEDSVDGATVSGAVAGGSDVYGFAGSLTDFQADGDVDLKVDGISRDPAFVGKQKLTVETASGVDTASYTLAVDGGLQAVDTDSEDVVSGDSATGTVAGGTDVYALTGDLTEFEDDADTLVRLDGTVVDTDFLGKQKLEIEVADDADSNVAWYEFGVSGDLEGVDLNSEDSVSGTTATGGVGGSGVDTYAFTGDLVSFDADAATTVRVDGVVVDTDFLGKQKLEISASDGTVVNYDFTVSGDLEGVDLNSEDSVSGTTATGGVGGSGVDTYAFTGRIEDFDADGGLDVFVDGQSVDETQFGGTELAITTTNPDTVVSYEFAVDGTLEGASLNDEDAISGTTASGAVAGGDDVYEFTGEFTRFSADGELEVTVDGEPVDPEQLAADTLPNSIVIDGSAADSEAAYAFEVSGDLAKDDTASIEDADDVTAGAADGTVTTDRDAFRFSGDLVAFDIDGYASVSFDVGTN